MPDRVPSPCVGVCELDPTSTSCRGCLRTVAEIMGWNSRSEREKSAIWARVRERRLRSPEPR